MNPFDRMPGPGPRGDRDGFDFLHLIGAFLGIALVLFAVVAIVLLLWNSFTVRTEVRALRAELARLSGNDGVEPGAVGARVGGPLSAGTPAHPASAVVNTGEFAVPPPRSASAAPVGTLAVPPATTAPTIPAMPPVAPVQAGQSPAAKAPATKAPATKAPASKAPGPKAPGPEAPGTKAPAPKAPRAPRKKPSGTAE